ncbi:acyl-CoA/acyl-ACP dehydrogenase [Neisseriaceae bacterium TC5R-5]|nr:acyl-CoA/acyl-ACP dehydrogenase [Neisseriaceae bacterium TC5R-5]
MTEAAATIASPAFAQPAQEAEALLSAVRAFAQTSLAEKAEAIDRHAYYPKAELKELARLGAMSAHLDTPQGSGDFGLTIRAIAEAARVCGATGFLMWCQSVCGLFMQQSANPALTSTTLLRHITGQSLGGTALSNPMKSYAQIETLLLKASPVTGGYVVNGHLPWVSNLDSDHYCGAVAAVMDGTQALGREVMFLLDCQAPGVTLSECPCFSGMEGTGTYALHLKNHFIGADQIIADPARPFIAHIRAAFVLLQCGIAAGVIQGAIDSMWAVEPQLGHVNEFLDERPAALQAELDELLARVMQLAATPFDSSDEFFLNILDVRAHGAELSLRAAQSALLHQGARGYLMSSGVQRRVRESHFVAIVTPAIKHLRKEMARLSKQEMPR